MLVYHFQHSDHIFNVPFITKTDGWLILYKAVYEERHWMTLVYITLYLWCAGVVSKPSDAKQRCRYILHTCRWSRSLSGHVFHGIFVQIQPSRYAEKGDRGVFELL